MGGSRAHYGLESRHAAFDEAAQAAQVVGCRLPVQLQVGTGQTHCAQPFAAHLGRAGEDVFDPRPWLGDAGVAPLLAIRQWLALRGLALDVHPPAVFLEASLAP